MSKEQISNSRVVVAAQFFQNVWGESAFVTRVVPLFVGLSALGNVFAQSFAMPRVKQELAKEGVLPFSRFWASDWPFNAPTGAIFLHWIFTSALILGSQTSDVYTFVTNVFIYSGNWIKVFLAVGLVYLNFAPSERWAEQRTTFRSSPLLTIFWIISLLFVQAAPFIPNTFLRNIPFYVVPTFGTSLLAIGTAYWLVWAKLLPAFGYHIQHEIVQMPDGSERVKYRVSLDFASRHVHCCAVLCCVVLSGVVANPDRCRGPNPRGGGGRDSGIGSGNSRCGEGGMIDGDGGFTFGWYLIFA